MNNVCQLRVCLKREMSFVQYFSNKFYMILFVVASCWLYKGIYTDAAICPGESSVSQRKDGRVRIYSLHSGDYNIQTLMTLSDDDKCQHITAVGVFRVYGVKFAIEKINADKTILPNVTLGYDVSNGCLSVPAIMQRGIEIAADYRNSFCYTAGNNCAVVTKQAGQNVAVIGAYYSYASLPLASLLSLHNIVQISYGSSSPLLSKKKLYQSFYRTIPSDKNQINVFAEILKAMNWTYVFVVASDDDYGKLAISDLKKEAALNKICFAGDMYIPHDTPETNQIAKQIVRKISEDNKAKVVVMFGYAQGMADHLLREAEKIGLERYWLTSEGWNPHILKVNAPPNQLKSVLTISLMKGNLPEFSSYLRGVIPRDYKCDVWLHTYIKQKYECDLIGANNVTFFGLNSTNQNKTCNLSITSVTEELIKQNPNQVNNLIDAVYALAISIQSLVDKLCSNSSIRCVPWLSMEDLNDEMQKVQFTSLQNRTIDFDANGDIRSVSYAIENLQENENGEFEYRRVGDWLKTRSKRLSLNLDEIKWPTWLNTANLVSQCGTTCQPGEYVIGKQGCCWECRQCPGSNVSKALNSDFCVQCPDGFHTRDNINCIPTPITYLSLDDSIGVIIVVINAVGLILTLVVMLAFCRQRHTPAIQATQPFVSVTSFIVLIALFSYVPLFVVQPNKTVCLAKHVYFSMVFAAYASLLYVQNLSVINFITKFAAEKAKHTELGQVFVFILLILIQAIFIGAWRIAESIEIEKYRETFDSILEKCKENNDTALSIFILIWPCVILAMATISAFPERHNPKNFRHPKLLNYACIASTIIALTYLFSSHEVKGKFQAMTLSLFVSGFGFVYLMCLLTPKLFLSTRHARQETEEDEKREDGITNNAYVTDLDDIKPVPTPRLTRL